jgi:hypothetical protein
LSQETNYRIIAKTTVVDVFFIATYWLP